MATARKLQGRKGLHIEAQGCIVNVYEGLYDTEGRSVTSVEIQADQYAGEPKWKIDGSKDGKYYRTRIIQRKVQ